MITIQEKKREYIDKEIFNILNLLNEIPASDKFPTMQVFGSIAHKIPIDITNRLIDAPLVLRKEDYTGRVVSKASCHLGVCTELSQENYPQLLKLSETIYKEKSIKSCVSKSFIESKIFDWLIKTHKAKKVEVIFSDYLISEIQGSQKKYKFHFPILYLEINKPFQIGDTLFSYFTKEYFDSLDSYRKDKYPENQNDTEELRKNYQGMVFASCVVKAEKEKAQEIAFSKCSLALDTLKMCSITTDIPLIEATFDIDSRVKVDSQNEIIVCNAENEFEEFNISSSRLARHYKIDDKEWEHIIRRNGGFFHTFLLSLSEDLSELQSLIINSIKRYGNAISNKNLHQRIIELFTILESLLLLDKNSPIIESVCKYCSKLVAKEIKERKSVIDLLRIMYDVRSSSIHHGKEIDFDIANLQKLQHIVVLLLANLVTKTEQHKTKQSLLQEIEDAILKAF